MILLPDVPGTGSVRWAARLPAGATSGYPEWRYIQIRRLLLSLEHSIDEGTQWVVFEPNDEPLWATVQRRATDD